MSTEPATYTDAYHEWDDRNDVFRVYLVPVDGGEDQPEHKAMAAVHFPSDGDTECRLYKAAFLRCAKDIARLPAQGGPLGFEKEAAAKRVASAVQKELAAIRVGKPGPSDDAIRIVLAMLPRRKVGET